MILNCQKSKTENLEGSKRKCGLHTMEYYSALKRKEILAPATPWMSLEDIMLSAISQIQKDKSCMIPLM